MLLHSLLGESLIDRFRRLAPDDGAGAGAGGSSATTEIDDTDSDSVVEMHDDGPPDDDDDDAGAGSGTATPASASQATAAPATPAAQAMQSISDYLSAKGHRFQEDDATFVERSVQARQWLSQNQDLLKMMQSNRDKFQAFLESEQKAEAAKREEELKARWYPKNDWDRSLERYIYKDENGQLRVADGADPTLIDRYQKAAMARRETLEQIADDPVGFFEPFEQRLENRLLEKVKEVVTQELLGPRDQEHAAAEIIRQVQPHLFTTDATGRQIPTVFGARYYQLAQEAGRLGIQDSQQIHSYAIHHIQQEHEFYRQNGANLWQQQQAQGGSVAAAVPPGVGVNGVTPAAVANDAAKAKYVQSAARTANQSGARRSSVGSPNSEQEGMGIRERLMKALENVPLD